MMRIMLVGDVSCGEHFFSFGHGPRSVVERGENLFAGVLPLLKMADVVIANLEGPLSDLGLDTADPASRVFRGSPRTLAQLKSAGITVLSVANNHMAQHGEMCFEDTVSRLRAAGIEVAGIGSELQETLVGLSSGHRLAVLAASEVPEAYIPEQRLYTALDRGAMLSRVQELTNAGNTVVVSLHWGEEGPLAQSEDQRLYARKLIAAGAKIVFGHHPHVVYALEWLEGGVVACSLGNFVFDLPWDLRLRRSVVLDVSLSRAGSISDVKVWPVMIRRDGRPTLNGRAVSLASEAYCLYPSSGHLRAESLRKLMYLLGNLGRGETKTKLKFLGRKFAERLGL